MKSIKTERIRLGLTQKKMSDLLGIPQRTIEDWEAGRRKCPGYVERLVLEKLDRLDETEQTQGRLTIDFSTSDLVLIEHLEKQPNKQGYIKNLIRKDMLIIKTGEHVELSMEEQSELFDLYLMEKEKAESFAEYYKKRINEIRHKK